MPATDVSSTQPSDLERLLAEPYWVIDLLPAQVPADSPGQFFGVERHLLASPWHRRLRRSFAEVLLKLNCYHDLVVYRGERPRGRANPSPRKLERWVRANRETLAIHLTSADAAGAGRRRRERALRVAALTPPGAVRPPALPRGGRRVPTRRQPRHAARPRGWSPPR